MASNLLAMAATLVTMASKRKGAEGMNNEISEREEVVLSIVISSFKTVALSYFALSLSRMRLHCNREQRRAHQDT